MTIQLLLTGDELMAGHTVDSNSARIAEALAGSGYRVARKVTVGDQLPVLIDEIRQLATASSVLIINGGLGPTVDDLTAEALAAASGDTLWEHPAALEHLEHWCARIGLPLSAANRKQALLPSRSAIIANPIGSAVGFHVVHDQCLIICTPGVPAELEAMLAADIPALIQARLPPAAVTQTRLLTFGLGESTIQQRISTELPDWPDSIQLGFRAGYPLLEVKLTAGADCPAALLQQWLQRLRPILGDYLVADSETTLAETLVKTLIARGQQLASAESCTGGRIAAEVTSVAGASAVFPAGLVTYSNAMKTALLGVPASLLEAQGAVSEAVVLAMAEGVAKISGADLCIAVSGIAGPDGGSPDKPVGTVWIAWGHPGQLRSRRLVLNVGRARFQQMVTAIGLDLLRRELMGLDPNPGYLRDRR